jgi:hypothetical protein
MNGTKLDRFVLTEQKKAYIIPFRVYIIPETPETPPLRAFRRSAYQNDHQLPAVNSTFYGIPADEQISFHPTVRQPRAEHLEKRAQCRFLACHRQHHDYETPVTAFTRFPVFLLQ